MAHNTKQNYNKRPDRNPRNGRRIRALERLECNLASSARWLETNRRGLTVEAVGWYETRLNRMRREAATLRERIATP